MTTTYIIFAPTSVLLCPSGVNACENNIMSDEQKHANATAWLPRQTSYD